LILPGFSFYPLFFLSSPWLVSGFFPLAVSSLRVILHCCNLMHSVPPIREIFPSLVVVIVPLLILARLVSLRRINLDHRLHWITQCVAICHTYHLGQGGWHVSL
jgi:hypothetical protein